MNRRQFLSTTAATFCAAMPGLHRAARAEDAGPGIGAALAPLWQAWRAAHLDPSGRVIDGRQGGVSHSEGQGYAMLLAATLGDRATFERLDRWTEDNLALRDDALLAWRWLPKARPRVPDLNNATDGDLFHGWALLRAAERLGVPAYRTRARAVAKALAAACLVPRPDAPERLLLLPGVDGFRFGETIVVNPSYLMPRALRELAEGTGTPLLAKAAEDGLELIREIGSDRPTPDWVALTPNGLEPAISFAEVSGYEALRVPLFLIWSAESGHRALRPFLATIAPRPTGEGTATVLSPQGEPIERSPDPGYAAIAALTRCAAAGEVGAAIPPFEPAQPYFPATLHLMALVAQQEAEPACFPM